MINLVIKKHFGKLLQICLSFFYMNPRAENKLVKLSEPTDTTEV